MNSPQESSVVLDSVPEWNPGEAWNSPEEFLSRVMCSPLLKKTSNKRVVASVIIGYSNDTLPIQVPEPDRPTPWNGVVRAGSPRRRAAAEPPTTAARSAGQAYDRGFGLSKPRTTAGDTFPTPLVPFGVSGPGKARISAVAGPKPFIAPNGKQHRGGTVHVAG